MPLADAPPPHGKDDASSGYYQDPLGAPKLREWDGARWTDRTRKLQPDDAEPSAAYTRSRLIVPRPFRFSGTYRLVEEDGREFLHVPGPRWFSRELRVCDSEGTEVARLRPAAHWLLPVDGYKVFRDDVQVGRLRSPEGSIKYGEGSSTFIAGVFDGGEYKFIREMRLVARLTPERRSLRRTTYYDLEIAQDIDPVPIVAACVGLDQMNRMVFTGGGG
jgi:uncharacterized protein YxjI